MATPNFGAILDQPSGAVERPKALPQGTYLFVTQGMPRQDKSTKKGTEFIEFTCKVLQAGEDVDPEALEEAGGIADKTMNLTFYLTEKSTYRLKEFMIDDLQIDDEEGEKTLRAMITVNGGEVLDKEATDILFPPKPKQPVPPPDTLGKEKGPRKEYGKKVEYDKKP